jgi:FkbM family methyltransferase
LDIRFHLRRLRHYQNALGFVAGLKWYAALVAKWRHLLRTKQVRIRPFFLAHSVLVRVPDSSDMDVFEHLFVDKEADYLDRIGHPLTVIDLGANVGYFSAYTLSLFRNATVLAVEPDPGNIDLCRRNLKPYGKRALICEGAAWPSRTALVLSRGTFRDGREWATEVRAAEQSEACDVQGWDMPTLIQMCPSGGIDLLKVDIEGSEQPLFSGNTDNWLDSVRNLCIEIHDEDCKLAVYHALESFEYDESSSGEYNLFLNLRRKR